MPPSPRRACILLAEKGLAHATVNIDLARGEQLEIKIAQGSKPGEGGQLPAKKATA